jgi:hypothetical protein
MKKLEDLVESAQEWMVSAKATNEGEVQLSDLSRLISVSK